jgi:hypothetical protein
VLCILAGAIVNGAQAVRQARQQARQQASTVNRNLGLADQEA